MKPLILIVEDNFLLAVDLVEVIQQELNAEAVVSSRVSDALPIVPGRIALALLDIEVLDGKTYPVARKLLEHSIPVVFISGNEKSSLPEDLKNVPFLPKPYDYPGLVKLAKGVIGGSA